MKKTLPENEQQSRIKNFTQQQSIYKQRVIQFIREMNHIDPKWIHKHSWFDILKTFLLGKNFFEEAFRKDMRDKTIFYTKVFTPACLKVKKKNELEKGFMIERIDEDNDYEKQDHQELLDFIWWNIIYDKGLRVKMFNAEEKEVLEKIRTAFYARIKNIKNSSQ